MPMVSGQWIGLDAVFNATDGERKGMTELRGGTVNMKWDNNRIRWLDTVKVIWSSFLLDQENKSYPALKELFWNHK